MVGSALVRKLAAKGYANLLTAPRSELDLLDQTAVAAFMARHRPDYVFVAAAKVGGILANNTRRAEFLYFCGTTSEYCVRPVSSTQR